MGRAVVRRVVHDPKQLQAAEALIAGGRSAEAERLLAPLAADMPAEWSAQRRAGGVLHIAFWSLPDFMDYVSHCPSEPVAWEGWSWSKLCYLRAFVAVDAGDLAGALGHLERGLAYEPDHPLLRCEQALVLSHLGRIDEAIDVYQSVIVELEARPWIGRGAIVALRGLAGCHLEAGRLDEAEQLYRLSLEYEPDNAVATHELARIAELRRSRSAQVVPRIVASRSADPALVAQLDAVTGGAGAALAADAAAQDGRPWREVCGALEARYGAPLVLSDREVVWANPAQHGMVITIVIGRDDEGIARLETRSMVDPGPGAVEPELELYRKAKRHALGSS